MATHDASDLQMDIDPRKLKPLFKTKPHLHAAGIGLNWAIILMTIVGCLQFFNPFTYVLAVIIIGARMHALAILMHDASHYGFLKSRKWNDRITNFTTMYFLFSSIEKYRNNHLRHHQHLNTEDDPDWMAKLGKKAFTFPKTKKEFLITVFSYFSLYRGTMDALWFLKRFGASDKAQSAKSNGKVARLVFYVLFFTALTLLGYWKYFAIFWVVPYLSTFFMFQYIRSVAEHFGDLSYDDLLTSTRTVKATFLEKLIFSPHNVGYHLEHHLYPGVPFYNLPKLHALLMDASEYHANAHVTNGYVKGLLNELS